MVTAYLGMNAKINILQGIASLLSVTEANIKPPVAGTVHGPNTFFLILKEMGLKDKDVPIEE